MSYTSGVGDALAAMQLHDASITSGSTNGHHFRFLDLAAGISLALLHLMSDFH